MSKQERRMERVYQQLSAVERARLVLEDYKADRQPDQTIRWTTPDDQWDDFARLIRTLKATNEVTGWLALSWEARLREVETLRGWYMSVRLWGTLAWETSWSIQTA